MFAFLRATFAEPEVKSDDESEDGEPEAANQI